MTGLLCLTIFDHASKEIRAGLGHFYSDVEPLYDSSSRAIAPDPIALRGVCEGGLPTGLGTLWITLVRLQSTPLLR